MSAQTHSNRSTPGGQDGPASPCPKCGSADYDGKSWCKSCGYYGVLGTCVEVDPGEPYYEAGNYVGPQAQAAPEHPWIAALQAVPGWAWKLGGVLAAIWVATVMIRLTTVPGSAYRIVTAVGLVVVGGLVFLAAHIYAGLRSLNEDADASLLDLATHPLRLWVTVFLHLPRSFKHVACGCGGLWTVILAHVIVGIPYLQLVDLTAPPPKVVQTIQPSDIAAAAAAAGSAETPTLDEIMEELDKAAAAGQLPTAAEEKLTLKDAIRAIARDLMGEDAQKNPSLAGLVDEPEPAEGEAEPEFVRRNFDAVIMGYRRNRDTRAIESLVVAVSLGGRWHVAGRVSGLTGLMQQRLELQVDAIRRDRPFVPTEHSAIWVDPVLRCQIAADYLESEHRFESLQLLRLY